MVDIGHRLNVNAKGLLVLVAPKLIDQSSEVDFSLSDPDLELIAAGIAQQDVVDILEDLFVVSRLFVAIDEVARVERHPESVNVVA